MTAFPGKLSDGTRTRDRLDHNQVARARVASDSALGFRSLERNPSTQFGSVSLKLVAPTIGELGQCAVGSSVMRARSRPSHSLIVRTESKRRGASRCEA
jgi:hypothetical protein